MMPVARADGEASQIMAAKTGNLRLRPDLTDIGVYRAGSVISGAVKLDSNELAFGPLKSVRVAISLAAAECNRYPDNSGAELTSRLAGVYGVDPDDITLGAGSVSLCQQLVQASCCAGDEVIIPWRSFEVYPALARIAGAVVRAVPLTVEHKPDVRKMAAAISDRTRVIFLCTPNNPTGAVLSANELAWFFDAVGDDVVVVLDEAYREFAGDADSIDGIRYVREQILVGRRNLVAMRTFSKAYGLAGLRIGYCVTHPVISEALRRVAAPYAVSNIAQRAAIASLGAAGELSDRCMRVAAERDRVRAALVGYGYGVPASGGNFLWLPLGPGSETFRKHCLEHRILVRAFAGEGVRVTIGSPDENDKFIAAAGAFPCLA
jgi:histidinol-phosphate aminotransferase